MGSINAIFILQTRKLRQIKYSGEGYTVSKWQNYDWKPRQPVSEAAPLAFIVLPLLCRLSRYMSCSYTHVMSAAVSPPVSCHFPNGDFLESVNYSPYCKIPIYPCHSSLCEDTKWRKVGGR